MFRKFNNRRISWSEMSWTVLIVVPLLEEFLSVQHEIMFNCVNSSSSAGSARRAQGGQSYLPSRPDVIGLAAEGQSEVFYSEIKLEKATAESQNIDRLWLAIFYKDALDLYGGTAIPPVVSFQVIGKQVAIFAMSKQYDPALQVVVVFAARDSREARSTRRRFLFTFQVQTLIKTTPEMLTRKRSKPIAIQGIPTMTTPDRMEIMVTGDSK
ncbi:hypothetical protein BX616_001889 [Lobosporangium transversale]|uniref:Uncharacterized protein n=1 Tax=Lobosporangium transversale TaxID=64571 RepID=A0A1Y2GNV1_9FUNG|nr:hypothetical protein BCR41DRAFT_396112 [Lobosporangium transversale]KAF9917113.1 hypothetical protein BX616_001889 [Lobosporangium transversale]ORZ16842.1 hypothetical protein BCR41DRAFT_396112 [Lobosporangium transversale]|eukprot:XP_021881777.1 hypothetical protein BCR41DRAFT_396112 [Lobosporangium transversale]